MGTFIEFDAPSPGGLGDFWRSMPGAALPDGTTDQNDDISRNGRVAIATANFGPVVAQVPVAALDIFGFAGRSGVDGRVVNQTPMYVTGNLPAMGVVTTPPATPVGGIEFRHSNQTQGIGFAYDGIYATGSVADQNFSFSNRGTGQYAYYHQALLGGLNYTNYVGAAITANQGWQERWYANGGQVFGELRRRSARVVPGGALATEFFHQALGSTGAFRNMFYNGPSRIGAGLARMEIGENDVVDDKLVLFGVNSAQFYGLGIRGSTMAYFCGDATAHHRWYANTAVDGAATHVFSVSGIGNVTIDPLGTAGAGFGTPVLRFGGEGSDEGIRSQRTVVDRFQEDIEVYTQGARRFAVLANGRLYAANVPTFATDALAGAGGLAVGEIWKDALGGLHIKL